MKKKKKPTEDCIDNTGKSIRMAFASFGKGSKPSKTGQEKKCFNQSSLHASTKKASNSSWAAKIAKLGLEGSEGSLGCSDASDDASSPANDDDSFVDHSGSEDDSSSCATTCNNSPSSDSELLGIASDDNEVINGCA